MKKLSAACLVLCVTAVPAFGQASVDVQAGNLRGSAQAGTNIPHDNALDRSDRQVARGPRTDDTRDCDSRGVTVHSGNGSSSASVSTSGGSSVVAGGGSPGSRTEYFGCDAPTHSENRSNR
jgi:hypothetical protein